MIPERKVGTYSWNTADLLGGRMFVGGPMWAKVCPRCGSESIEIHGHWDGATIKCLDCRASFGGASARA